jgi:glycosyltransferase involved in cell wall biosynthesis
MVLALAKELANHPAIEFVVAGKCANWTDEETRWIQGVGIYKGFLKGAEYERLFQDADGVLVCNGFEEEARAVERTNFKSKFVDYLASGLPVFIWAPQESSSSGFSRREGVGILIARAGPEDAAGEIATHVERGQIGSAISEKSWQNLREFFDAGVVLPRILAQILELSTTGNHFLEMSREFLRHPKRANL